MTQSQALPAFKVDYLMCKVFKEPLGRESQGGRGGKKKKKALETVVHVDYNDYLF